MIRLVLGDVYDAMRLVGIGRAATPDTEYPWNVFDYIIRGALPGAIVLADTGVQLGFISLQCAADEAEILNIATIPPIRRKGLATELLTEGERLAALNGARRIFLEVAADNVAAQALYGRAGYAQVGERRAYYKRPDGSRMDALVLARDLPAPDLPAPDLPVPDPSEAQDTES